MTLCPRRAEPNPLPSSLRRKGNLLYVPPIWTGRVLPNVVVTAGKLSKPEPPLAAPLRHVVAASCCCRRPAFRAAARTPLSSFPASRPLRRRPGPSIRLLARARAAFAAIARLDRHGDTVASPISAQPSAEPRFYLLDTASGRVSRHFVAHGRGSDPDIAAGSSASPTRSTRKPSPTAAMSSAIIIPANMAARCALPASIRPTPCRIAGDRRPFAPGMRSPACRRDGRSAAAKAVSL